MNKHQASVLTGRSRRWYLAKNIKVQQRAEILNVLKMVEVHYHENIWGCQQFLADQRKLFVQPLKKEFGRSFKFTIKNSIKPRWRSYFESSMQWVFLNSRNPFLMRSTPFFQNFGGASPIEDDWSVPYLHRI